MKQPVRAQQSSDSWSREKQNRLSNIIAISCGDGKPTTAAFAVHLKGNEQNAMEIKQFAGINSRDKDLNNRCVEELCTWIRDQGEVQGIMVSGFSVETFRLYDKLNRQELGPKIIQDAVARRYMNSTRAQEEFPTYSALLRYTIALARVSQEPLWEFAALCNETDDLLGLNLHSMQSRIPILQIRGCWERAFMNVVNSVGIDVNMALRNPAVAGAMRFVCGLGPRKVQSILSKLRSKVNDLIRILNGY
jgi:transcriptional accessory protein Tex/SPT6